MSSVGDPFIPIGTSNRASERWQKLLAQMPLELLQKTDIHEMHILSQLVAISHELRKKMECDPGDAKSCRMLNQIEVIFKRFREGSGLKPSVALNVEDSKDNLSN